MNILQFDVEKMAKLLNRRKNAGGPPIVLFLGSRTGSLFRQSFLAELLRGFSYHDLLNMPPIERFSKCYQILEGFKKEQLDRDIHLIIRQALQEQHLEVADICVAELMRQRVFDSIITTNIGNELELAFRQNGMEEPRDFKIVIPGLGEPIPEVTRRDAFKMIKASGDFAANSYTISNTQTYIEEHSDLKRIFEQLKGTDMLIVGLDPTWDKHVIDAISPRTAENLWYVNEAKTLKDDYILSKLQACHARRLEGTIGEYETFFMNLCRHVLGSIPIYRMTLNKLSSMEKMLHDLQKKQIILQQQLNKIYSRNSPSIKEDQQQKQPSTTSSIKVYYAYTPADEDWRKKIEAQLGLLRQRGLIDDEWHSGKLTARIGATAEIEKHWQEAQIILLLVSAELIHNDYNLVREAMKRHDAKTAEVIPILLRPIDLDIAVFNKLNVLPTNKQPITIWSKPDEALWDVAKGVRSVIEQLTGPIE